jgi:hypothetical protein
MSLMADPSDANTCTDTPENSFLFGYHRRTIRLLFSTESFPHASQAVGAKEPEGRACLEDESLLGD